MLKNKKFLSIILVVSIFVATLLLDLLTKGLIIPNHIPKVGDNIDVIPGFINFIYVKNTGAAWGMFAGRPIFLIIISILVLGLLLAYYGLRIKRTNEKSSVLFGISIGLIAGGCIGNLIDRIIFGYVRDFINFQFMNFPVFNFADIALTVGMAVLVVYFIFFYSKEEKSIKETKQNKNQQINISLSNVDELESIENDRTEETDNDSSNELSEGDGDER